MNESIARAIAQIDTEVERAKTLRAMLIEHEQLFGERISAGTYLNAGLNHLHLHYVADPKALVRALGGEWKKKRESDRFDYEGMWNGFRVVIFGAEELPHPTPTESLTL